MRFRYLRRRFIRRHYAGCVMAMSLIALLLLSYTNCTGMRIAPVETEAKNFQQEETN